MMRISGQSNETSKSSISHMSKLYNGLMKETAISSPENRRYNDESNFLDGLYEFHPEFFDMLAEHKMKSLQTYYLLGRETPENVFTYRHELIQQQPEIENEARQAFHKLLKLAGIKEFHYSHD
jgi:hypothetical protein